MFAVAEKKVRLTLCEDPIRLDQSLVPATTGADYLDRIERLLHMAAEKQFTHVLVYGDREHFANLCYLTGLDPRFEEALLVLRQGQKPALLLGNECMDYSVAIPFDIERISYQNFSLLGQPRDKSRHLDAILRDLGIDAQSRLALIGWKTYPQSDFAFSESPIDLPCYIVDTLCTLTDRKHMANATDLMLDCEYGMRCTLSAKEIVQFEAMGTKASRKVYDAIKNLRTGLTEIEASALLCMDGEPTSMHPNVNFKQNCGLASPDYTTRLELGDNVGIGFGYRGSLVHKQGIYIHNMDEMPAEKRELLDGFMKPYFAAMAAWYESLAIGTSFATVYDAVDKTAGLEALGIGLNPGHLIHLDEWTHSPIVKDSPVNLRSGMAIQCDFTATHRSPYASIHAEDGLVIADAALQEEIKALSPAAYERMIARRTFVRDVLNIALADEVLPLSDTCGVFFPYMADVSVLFCKA